MTEKDKSALENIVCHDYAKGKFTWENGIVLCHNCDKNPMSLERVGWYYCNKCCVSTPKCQITDEKKSTLNTDKSKSTMVTLADMELRDVFEVAFPGPIKIDYGIRIETCRHDTTNMTYYIHGSDTDKPLWVAVSIGSADRLTLIRVDKESSKTRHQLYIGHVDALTLHIQIYRLREERYGKDEILLPEGNRMRVADLLACANDQHRPEFWQDQVDGINAKSAEAWKEVASFCQRGRFINLNAQCAAGMVVLLNEVFEIAHELQLPWLMSACRTRALNMPLSLDVVELLIPMARGHQAVAQRCYDYMKCMLDGTAVVDVCKLTDEMGSWMFQTDSARKLLSKTEIGAKGIKRKELV